MISKIDSLYLRVNTQFNMDKKIKQFFVKSFVVLVLIHLGYFLYGYFTFKGMANIYSNFEFYRFKFYDDVSISHFFISGLFLFFFLIFLLRNHFKQKHTTVTLFKISGLLLLISFFSFTFFVSFSFGQNAKLRKELSETDFNKDKQLLNVLHPFLYNYTSYSSEKLFNPVNILFPKPYPVIAVTDSTLISDNNYVTETIYYSIDTLKVPTAEYTKVSDITSSLLSKIGFDAKELSERIIKKNVIGDETEIIYKGMEVRPEYDADICVFIKSKKLFLPLPNIPVEEQEYNAAVKRYNLLYTSKQDSLLYNFQKLDTLLKKYKVESSLIPKKLVKDVLFYKDNNDRIVTEINNSHDRKMLSEKFTMLNKLYYEPNYLHPSILNIFMAVVLGVWLVLFLICSVFNLTNKKTLAP